MRVAPRLVCWLSLVVGVTGATPLWATPRTRLLDVRVSSSTPDGGRVPVNARLEVVVRLSRRYANPFAPYPVNPSAPEAEQVDELGAKADAGGATLTGEFAGPGCRIRIPAFWDGDAWRVRMTPTRVGRWVYHIEVRDAAGRTRSQPRAFMAVPSARPGFIRVRRGSRFLWTGDGRLFLPLGNNLVKSTDHAVIETWAARLQAHGMNSQRVWLHPHHTAVEWNAKGSAGPSFVPDAPGLGRYCLRTARSTDHVIESAWRHGLYLILSQDDAICYQPSPHGEPRIGWEYNPYRVLCRDGIAFFTDATARRYYKRRLRYMVARWGYSQHVFAWELMNEVDWPYLAVVYPDKGSRWRLTDLVAWHDEMAHYLRAVDPYRRPVSTNTASNPLGWGGSYPHGTYDDRFFLLHEPMDLANHHIYGLDQDAIARIAARFAEAVPGKPLLIGEWGLDPYLVKAEKDVVLPVGLHNALWIGLTTSGGAPYHWFWDKYYKVGGLRHYQVAARLLREMTLSDEPAFVAPEVSGAPSVKAYSLSAKSSAVVWVWDTSSRQGAPEPPPVHGARLSILGLGAGTYRQRVVSTWSGAVLSDRRAAHRGGTLLVDMPAFRRDVAVLVALWKGR